MEMMDMTTDKSSGEQMIGFLRHAEAGMPVKQIRCKHGLCDASFYKWRSKYGGMDASEAKRLRELELENGKLNDMRLGRLLQVVLPILAIRRVTPSNLTVTSLSPIAPGALGPGAPEP